MKERLRFCLSFFLAILLVVLLCGCAGTEGRIETDPTTEDISSQEILEGRHRREDDYMADFQTHMLSVGPFTLHMENRIYEETALREAAKMLLSDLSALEKTTGEKPEAVTVYLVGSTPYGSPQVVGSQVFCCLEDFESGTYREALAGAVYALPCVWQRVGLTEFVFGEEKDIDLKDYYADSAHALTASCSAMHLSPVLSDAETVLAARQTSKSLTAFILESDDFSAFREATDPGSLLPTWSNSMEISPALSLPVRSADAAELTLGMKTGTVCVLRVKNFTVEISKDSWLLDPDGLYSWFCSFFDGMDMVLEQIAAEAPSTLPIAEQRYTEPVTIVFDDPYGYTYTYPNQNKIILTKDNAIWHEMVHLLLEETVVIEEQVWLEEALAEHFSYAAQTRYTPTRYYSEGFDAYLQFFFFFFGRGKTYKIYEKMSAETNLENVILIVPDQSSFINEKRILNQFGAAKASKIRVFGFNRLYDYLSEKFNEVPKQRIDDGAKNVLMSIATEEVSDKLDMYAKKAQKADFAELMLSAVNEYKLCAISPEQLFKTAEKISDEHLKQKIKESALIYSAYDVIVNEAYSDPSDDMERLYQILCSHDFFRNKRVYIDSFNSFSAQEYTIVEQIIEQADYVGITIGCSANSNETDENSIFREPFITMNRLSAFANENNIKILPCINLTQQKRFSSPSLQALEESFFRFDGDTYSFDDNAVQLYEGLNEYDEIQQVARNISLLVREHDYSYNDITVICRDADVFRHVIESEFPKYDIPFFMSEKSLLKIML